MNGTITVWLADLRLLEGREEQWMPLLTPARRARVERVRTPSGKLELAASGLLLRRVLGVTEDGQLEENEHGKLMLADGGPHFSLSHGGACAALAVADFSVGVDVEPVGENPPIRTPKRFLTPDEIAWLEEEPTGARFAWLWTRLESVLKADGRGFAMGKRSFSLLGDGGPWQLHTFFHCGHCVSCAAQNPFEVAVREIVL